MNPILRFIGLKNMGCISCPITIWLMSMRTICYLFSLSHNWLPYEHDARSTAIFHFLMRLSRSSADV